MPTDGHRAEPEEAGGSNGAAGGAGDEAAELAVAPMTRQELLSNQSIVTTTGSDALARDALDILEDALSTGKLKFSGKDFSEESFVKSLKSVGIYVKLKGLLPHRSSVLSVEEVDVSHIPLYNEVPDDAGLIARWDAKRRAQTLQAAVQFVRVSTAAKIVRLENCNLQGTTHDREDLIEQEVIRLVKKFGFGSGKDARYTSEVSLAKNKFEDAFAKKIIEGAHWERAAHPDKENLPRLHLDLRGNRIRNAARIVNELREGQSAAGPVNVATVKDSQEDQKKAIVVVNFDDQEAAGARGASPPRAAPPRPRPAAPAAPALARRGSGGGGCSRSPSRKSGSASYSRSRSRGGRRGGGGARRKHRRGGGRDRRRGGGDRRRRRRTRGGGGGRRGGGGGGGRRRRRRDRSPSPEEDDSYDYDDTSGGGESRSPSRPKARRRASGGGGGGGKRQKARGKKKEPPPSDGSYYSDDSQDSR